MGLKSQIFIYKRKRAAIFYLLFSKFIIQPTLSSSALRLPHFFSTSSSASSDLHPYVVICYNCVMFSYHSVLLLILFLQPVICLLDLLDLLSSLLHIPGLFVFTSKSSMSLHLSAIFHTNVGSFQTFRSFLQLPPASVFSTLFFLVFSCSPLHLYLLISIKLNSIQFFKYFSLRWCLLKLAWYSYPSDRLLQQESFLYIVVLFTTSSSSFLHVLLLIIKPK